MSGAQFASAQSVTGSGLDPDTVSSPNWDVGGNLNVGVEGTAGSLEINDGGTVANANGAIGNAANTQGTVTISGHDTNGNASTWTNSGSFNVGLEGHGILDITNGGVVKASGLGYVGNHASGKGVITVSGRDANGNASTFNTSDQLQIGRAGIGTISVLDGGVVNAGVTESSFLGYEAGSKGTLIVSGRDTHGNASTFNGAGQIQVGRGGTGSLSVLDGGIVNSRGFDLIAAAAGGEGEVIVSGHDAIGNASIWNSARGIAIGNSGTGKLSILDGGVINAGTTTEVALSSDIGRNAGSYGRVTVSGVDANGNASAWNSIKHLEVGSYGTGNLDVLDGGAVIIGGLAIGEHEGSTGIVTVFSSNDSTSRLSVTAGTGLSFESNINIGTSGTGTLAVSRGGVVSAVGDTYMSGDETSTATLHLNGDTNGRGIVETGSVIKRRGTIVIDLNGGILRATKNHSNFLNGFETLTVGDGGAWFDSNSYNIGIATSFSGSSSLNKQGDGKLTITGDSSGFTGTTTVEKGTLVVGDAAGINAALGGDVYVWSDATLAGQGTVGNTTVLAGGILSPGNSPGTLTVNGDLTLAADSTLEIGIAGNGKSDRVEVAGAASVGGSIVSVTAIDSETSYQNGQTYYILHATGGITGEFARAVSESAFLDVSVANLSDTAGLTICLKTGCPQQPVHPADPDNPDTPVPPLFSTVTSSGNQHSTAAALDSLAQTGSSLNLYNSMLILSADDARAAFDSLSGEAHASAKVALVDHSQFIRNAALGRLQQAFGGAPATQIDALSYAPLNKGTSVAAIDNVAPASISAAQHLYTGWGYAYGAWTRQDSNGHTGDMKSSIGGFVTGIDGIVVDTWRLGLLAGYSRSSFHMDERASSGSSDNYTLGVYAGTQWALNSRDVLAFRSGIAYTWHKIDMSRSVAFPGFSDYLTSAYDAGSFQVFGELGYKLSYGKAQFEPYAGLAYLRLKTHDFDEKGLTAAALSASSDTMDTSFSTLGLRASTDFVLGTVATTVRADIAWRHAYGDITPVSTASFVGSNAFTVSGLPIAKDAALIEAGLDFKLTDATTLGLSYNGQFASGAMQNGLNAKFSVGF